MRLARRLVAAVYRPARTVFTALRLLLTVLLGRSVELWVGDSHATAHTGRMTSIKLSRRANGAYVWYLGPRLMWSLARQGWPRPLLHFADLLGSVAPRPVVDLHVIVGEIDVRAHLAVRPAAERDDFDFVAEHVERVMELGDLLMARTVTLVVPPPPTAEGAVNPAWPVRGTFEERLAQFDGLRRALARGVLAAEYERVRLLDATPMLTDLSGGLAATITDDRVHINATGVAIVREEAARLHELPTTAQRVPEWTPTG